MKADEPIAPLLEEAFDRIDIGSFNLAIYGPTGVGKSTLVNTIFGRQIAPTGVGAPITRGNHFYEVPGARLGVMDTRGLEVGADTEELLAGLRREFTESLRQPTGKHVHVIWYCVRASDRRFSEAEATFVRSLAELGPPVLLVLTRTPRVDGKVPETTDELVTSIRGEKLPIVGGRVHAINAVRDDWVGIEAHGLDELLHATLDAAPEGVRNALVAAQHLNAAPKFAASHQLVAAAAASLADRALLTDVRATWAGLIAQVALIYGMPRDQAVAATARARELATLRRLLYAGQLGWALAPGAAAARLALLRSRGRRPHRFDPAAVPDPPARSADEVDPQEADPGATSTEIRSGLAAKQVTLAVGGSWVDVCDRAYRDAFPDPPVLDPDAFAERLSQELSERLPAHLRAYLRLRGR